MILQIIPINNYVSISNDYTVESILLKNLQNLIILHIKYKRRGDTAKLRLTAVRTNKPEHTMDKTVISNFLKDIELFKELDDEELAYLTEIVKIREYKTDEMVFSENNPRKRIYIVYEGRIELFKRSPTGQDKRLASFSKLDFLGEGALMDNYPHATSARVKEPTTVFTIDREDFREQSKAMPELAYKVLSGAARVIGRPYC